MHHWVFKGVVHYLHLQCDRLGIDRVIGQRARNNYEAGQIATALSQLTDRHKAAYRPDGVNPVFYPPDQALIRGIFDRAEEWLKQLHVLAASADNMLDDAYRNFPPLAPPKRLFSVVRETSTPEPPPPDPKIAAFDVLARCLAPSAIDDVIGRLDDATASLVLMTAFPPASAFVAEAVIDGLPIELGDREVSTEAA